jgi:hypothetical protein
MSRAGRLGPGFRAIPVSRVGAPAKARGALFLGLGVRTRANSRARSALWHGIQSLVDYEWSFTYNNFNNLINIIVRSILIKL